MNIHFNDEDCLDKNQHHTLQKDPEILSGLAQLMEKYSKKQGGGGGTIGTKKCHPSLMYIPKQVVFLKATWSKCPVFLELPTQGRQCRGKCAWCCLWKDQEPHEADKAEQMHQGYIWKKGMPSGFLHQKGFAFSWSNSQKKPHRVGKFEKAFQTPASIGQLTE